MDSKRIGNRNDMRDKLDHFRIIANFTLLVLFVLLCSPVHSVHAMGSIGYWWNLGLLSWRTIHQSPSYTLAPKPLCSRIQGLSHSQARLCQRHFDHMPVISIGAKLGIHECQKQFKFRHWNCSSENDASAFGPITNLGSREASFAHAISAAGVVHALARSCKEARLFSCGCSKASRPEQLHRDWIWGGCGDNIAYAYRFAKAFIDIREKEQSHPRHSPNLARMLMNLHNNRAGRLAVYQQASVACKCHGVSGSCSLRTCWTQLSPFSRIGEHLRTSYDQAIQVKFNRRGTKLRQAVRHAGRIKPDQLVYLEVTPDYCSLDAIDSTPLTKDRECLLDSETEFGCDELCCGRGTRTLIREIREKCRCQFHWCCKIECQTCVRTEQYQVCN